MGVTTFFLFVEGNAASPNTSKVLESIPVSSHDLWCYQFVIVCFILILEFLWFYFLMFFLLNYLVWAILLISQGVKLIYRTTELEEQQAKRLASFHMFMFNSFLFHFEANWIYFLCITLISNEERKKIHFCLKLFNVDDSMSNSLWVFILFEPCILFLYSQLNHLENFQYGFCFVSPLNSYRFYAPFFLISRIWNETWLSSFFYKPCNYELFVKQSLNMEMAIVMARVCIMHHYLLIYNSTLPISSNNKLFWTFSVLTNNKILGCRNGLDTSSWHWWTDSPCWCPWIFFEAVAAWCSWKCGYGCVSKLCESHCVERLFCDNAIRGFVNVKVSVLLIFLSYSFSSK